MFTGLIRTTGEIRRVDQRGDRIIAVAMHEPFDAAVGDSIACNGICLTVTKIDGNVFKAAMSDATLACTTAGDWHTGTKLNLEPSLRVGDAMGGHFVSGHVDGVGRAISSTPSGDSTVWTFELPRALARFVAPKGSITIDGVSLTVNEVKDLRPNPVGDKPTEPLQAPASIHTFTVNIIQHTASVTCFKDMRPGDPVNLEIDLLARYAARLKEVAA